MQEIELTTEHPKLPGYTRKAVVLQTFSDHANKFSTLTVRIDNYLNGELVQTKAVNSYEVILRADNSVFVNPQNGQYVPADTPGAMGEYDFIDYLETQVLPYSNKTFKQNVVLRAEAMGRFDI